MLILVIKPEESIRLDGPGRVKILAVDGKRIKCGVLAPKATRIELVKD